MKQKREQPRISRRRAITPQTFIIPLIYYAFSVIWISTTDEVVAALSYSSEDMMLLSMYKGWFFVSLTSVLIAGMLIFFARKQYQAELIQKETDARMRALIENSPDIIARYGKDLKYLYVSPSIVALTGLKAQDCVGKTNRELGLISAFQQNLESLIQSVFETGTPVHTIYETTTPLGLINLDVRLIPEYGADGTVQSVLSTARDITEIVQVEKALRASEERYRELVEESQDAIAIYQDDQYVYANPASAHLLGYATPADVVGRSLDELIAPEDLDKVKSFNDMRLEGREAPVSYEARMMRQDGSKTWVEVSASLREYKGKPAVQVAYYSIDARKKAEEALKTREAMLHGIFAAAPIGIGMVRNRILGWTNTALQEMLGYSADELNGQSARILYESENEYQRVADVKHPLVEKDGIGRVETRFITKDGRELDILLSSAPIIAGRIDTGMVFTAMDITDRKRAMQALADSEERERFRAMEFEAILEAVPVAVFIGHDPKCEYMTGNQAAYDLVGVRPESNPSKSAPIGERPSFVTLRDGVEVPAEQLPMQTVAATGNPIFGSPLTIVKDDGTIRHALSNAVPLFDSEDKVRGVIGVFVDITELKQAEEALLAANTMLEALIQAIPDVVYMKDSAGTNIIVNRAFEEFTGLSRNDIIGRADAEIMTPEFAVLCDDSDVIVQKTLSQIRIEECAVNAKDEVHYYDTIKAPIISPDGSFAGIVGVSRDISGRKKMEEELRASEERFRAIAEGAQDLIFIKDLELRNTYTNPAMQAYYGVQEQDLLRKSARDLLGEELGKWAELEDARVLQGEIIRDDYQQELNGVTHYLSAVKVPIRDSTGAITSICGIVRDITEHMLLLEELKRYQEQIRSITDTMNAYLFSTEITETGEMKNYMATSGFERIFMQPPSAVVSDMKGWLERIHPDDIPSALEVGMRVMKNEPAVFEFRIKRQDGSTRWLRNDIQPSVDESGRVNAIQGFVYDITEQKEAEESALEAERRFHDLLDSIQLIVIGIDINGLLFYANPFIAKVVGTPSERLLGQKGLLAFVPAGWESAATKAYATTETSFSKYIEYPILNVRRQERLIGWSNTLLHDAVGEVSGILSIGMDITDARRAEEEIKKTSNMRRALSSRILSAHETERVQIARELHDVLGQVLTGIKMQLDWVRLHSDDSAVSERTQVITSQVDEAINAVRELAYGLRPPVLDDLGIGSALESLLRETENKSGIKCRLLLHAQTEDFSPALSTAIYRITQEALTNILRHSKATEATVRIKSEDSALILTISDNGVGFHPESAETQVSLGIAGMKERAVLLGGELTVQSVPDAGTTVLARFPIS